MIMRKGDLFRASKLHYREIGACDDAAAPLISLQWVDPQPALTIEEFASLLTKPN